MKYIYTELEVANILVETLRKHVNFPNGTKFNLTYVTAGNKTFLEVRIEPVLVP